MSNFAFLQSEWPAVYEAARKAETAAHPDPRTACFYARRALELAVVRQDDRLRQEPGPRRVHRRAVRRRDLFGPGKDKEFFYILDYCQNVEFLGERLRGLVKLIDRRRRAPIYTDFEDRMGDESLVDLPGFGAPDTFERFRAKARAFLREHESHIAIRKLRTNKALTPSDLDELERMLSESGIGGAGDLERAKAESHGLGLFVRSLVGLDREAAKEAFAGFLTGKTLNSSQIEFVNLIVDHLTEHGIVEPALLYESPFTDITPRGPDGLFSSSQLDELLAVLDQVKTSALAA